MEIKEFIEKFAEIFDDMEAAALTQETNFKELDEWSSLSALGLIAMVDEEYDMELKGEEIRKADTLGDLFRIINDKA